MRIYDGEFTVGRILDQCRPRVRDSVVSFHPGDGPNRDEIDIPKLARIIDRIPVQEIRARRQRLNTFYEEVLVSADPERGISFSVCLMILAHYKVIVDSKSLRLEEFLRRRARLQRVEEAVRRNTVIGFFDTLYWARRFRRHVEQRKSARMTAVPEFSIPEIFVDGQEHHDDRQGDVADVPTVPNTPIASPDVGGGGQLQSSPGRPSLQIDTSVSERGTSNEWSRPSISLSPRHPRDVDIESPDASLPLSDAPSSHGHTRDNSGIVQDMMQTLGDSAWGESIRRSFTQRRPSRQSGSKSSRKSGGNE